MWAASTQQVCSCCQGLKWRRVIAHVLKPWPWKLLLCLQDDEEAHKKFLRVNRAYEVLKDEDLRKKYDMYGEDGLKEGGPTGHGYQSWSFYNQDFGMLKSASKLNPRNWLQ